MKRKTFKPSKYFGAMILQSKCCENIFATFYYSVTATVKVKSPMFRSNQPTLLERLKTYLQSNYTNCQELLLPLKKIVKQNVHTYHTFVVLKISAILSKSFNLLLPRSDLNKHMVNIIF